MAPNESPPTEDVPPEPAPDAATATSEETESTDDGRAFLFVVPVAVVFVLTILLMIATTFGDPRHPLARFFDDHGLVLIGVEALLLVLTALASMTVDRWNSLRSR